jgi:hypothetical protein
VIATGLGNPRWLSYDHGRLYVALLAAATGLGGVSARNGHVWGVETYAPPEAGVPMTPPGNTLGKLRAEGPPRAATSTSAGSSPTW